jgi:hypothetical protein
LHLNVTIKSLPLKVTFSRFIWSCMNSSSENRPFRKLWLLTKLESFCPFSDKRTHFGLFVEALSISTIV